MKRLLLALSALLLLPALAHAQASITGVVQDTSGAVLPGVTVEVSSPALIEKVRSVVTDGSGQYRLVDLRPGAYTMTFTLAGFNTVRREGIQLSGSFVATVNAEMRVGALEETITVTGETPIVDTQSVRQQRVLGADDIAVLPTGRSVNSLAVLIPGVSTNTQDVGGNVLGSIQPTLTVHGSRSGDSRPVLIDGLSAANNEGSGQYTAYIPNTSSIAEMVVNTSGASAEVSTGGITVNSVPREGGNRFTGTFFGGFSNEALAGDNYSASLKARGLPAPSPQKLFWEVNPGFGGPIKQDKVWFFTAVRALKTQSWVSLLPNANLGKTTLPDAWLYAPDTSKAKTEYDGYYTRSANARITWQWNSKNKFSVFYDDQTRCNCPRRVVNVAPEAGYEFSGFPMNRFATLTWNSPVTSKMLLEAGFSNHGERWYLNRGANSNDPNLIPVTEQSTGLIYHGPRPASKNVSFPTFFEALGSVRASLTYVTGRHSMKVGMNDMWASKQYDVVHNPPGLTYRFNNGVPNQLEQTAAPFTSKTNLKADMGIYAQDTWTVKRLTMNLGLRYEYFNNYYPAQTLGPTLFTPDRNVSFPRGKIATWKDLDPRLGASYDLFGNGKTAVKASLSRYTVGNSLTGIYGDAVNPVENVAFQTTRSWNDANRNFYPDCDLKSPAANGECGAMANAAFGSPRSATQYDPKVLNGFGVRPFNWELSASVQHEIVPRVAVNVGYFRRWYGNFAVTDNRAVEASDYTRYSIVSPVDSRLPNGGGDTVSGLYDLNPNKLGQVSPYLTFAKNYGTQYEHWDGLDFTLNARLGPDASLQGGFSTGRTVADACDVVSKLPEMTLTINGASVPATTWAPYCHVSEDFQGQFKLAGAYTVPKVDVLVSGAFQSLPGVPVTANYVVTSAAAQQTLGRPLTGASNVQVNLVEPGTMWGDRLNQLDLRFGKVLKAAQARSTVSLDLFNALNANPVRTLSTAYASWLRPQAILPARYAKISVQFDF